MRRGRLWLAAAALCLAAPAAAQAALSLNEATLEQLVRVPGIDERMAEKIIYFRDQLGVYTSVRQLLSIPGMTNDLFERVKDRFFVPEAAAPPTDLWPGAYLEEGGDEGSSLDATGSGPEDNRLEELREKPIDLNRAQEDDLRELPGVDRVLARRILRERARRGKFASVQDLEQVPGFDGLKLEAVRPFVMVREKKRRVSGFSGDTRVRVRNVNPRGSSLLGAPDKFRNNSYVYNRTRLEFGDQSQVGWLAKRASVGAPLTPESLQRDLVFKFSVQETDIGPIDRLIVGNYTLSHGQGLVFYDGMGEYARPAKIKGRGPRPDYTSGANEYHKGAVLDLRLGDFDAEAFFSHKELDFEVQPDGTVDADLYSLRELLGDLQDEDDVLNNDTVTERLYGGRLAYMFWDNAHVGLMGYRSGYSHLFNPKDTSFSNAHVFRGDENSIVSMDFDAYFRTMNVFGEVAESRSSGPGVESKRGRAWTVTPMFNARPLAVWASYFDYDADFFTRHGKGVSRVVVGQPDELSDNQRGVYMGLRYDGQKYTNLTNYSIARFPEAKGNGDNSDPVHASYGRYLYFENAYKVSKGVTLYFRYQRDSREALDDDAGAPLVYLRDTQKFRYQVTWQGSPEARYRLRYETRYEDAAGESAGAFGHLIMGDVRYRPTKALLINPRIYFFDSDAFLTTGVEEIWNKVQYFRLAGSMNNLRGTGTRFFLIVKQSVGKAWEFWMKYDVNHQPGRLTGFPPSEDSAFSATRHGIHMQADLKWGGAPSSGGSDIEYETPGGEL
jgi:competence ComEA-like helix-hairpin-helix protein